MKEIRLQLGRGGQLGLSGWDGQKLDLWCNDRFIGCIDAERGGIDMRALRMNASIIRNVGGRLTALSADGKQVTSFDASLLSRLMEDEGVTSRMTSMIAPGKWTLYSIGVHPGMKKSANAKRLSAHLGIVLPEHLLGQDFDILCEGRPASDLFMTADPALGRTHWFMPEGCVISIRGTWDLDDLPDVASFTLAPKNSDEADWSAYRPLPTCTTSALPDNLPDVERIKRVAGPLANSRVYVNSGMTAFHRLRDIAQRQGMPFDKATLRVLDWGVGCGRVARYFADMDGVEIAGLDIDADNIDWCTAHLGGDYRVTDLSPPSSFETGRFDFIYSCSVLSHLTQDAIHAWLVEISRLLAPRGLALLSFNGSSNLASYLSLRPYQFLSTLETGFNDVDVNKELDGFIPSEHYYRQTFATEKWWHDIFREYFNLVEVAGAVVNGHQNIAVLKKKV